MGKNGKRNIKTNPNKSVFYYEYRGGLEKWKIYPGGIKGYGPRVCDNPIPWIM